MKEQLKILDCTLRDGGFYNNWDFGEKLPHALVSSLAKSGVDIVELGYRSFAKGQYHGPFKYCSETYLREFKKYQELEYALMLDAKEFSNGNRLNQSQLMNLVLPEKESLFSWIRVAAVQSQVDLSAEIIEALHDLGYRTTFNLMGMSLLSNEQITKTLKKIAESPVDVFYFADSFGSLTPESVTEAVRHIQSHFDRPIGFHSHDNKGLAFANSLAAINSGVKYIDATVSGMGRGPGNLRLEQLLLALYYQKEREDLNAFALLDVIQEYFEPLKEKYDWGWDFSYMVSGLMNIHPTYCQKLKSSHQYSMKQLTQILSDIPAPQRARFDSQQLENTTHEILKKEEKEEEKFLLPKATLSSKENLLVLATGPSVTEHQRALRLWIDQKSPQIFECNQTGVLKGKDRIVVTMNEIRLKEVLESSTLKGAKTVLCGLPKVSTSLKNSLLQTIPCEILSGELRYLPDQVTVPKFVVGMYALALALQCRPKKIFLAGFDGFGNNRSQDHLDMLHFWKLFQASCESENIEFCALTPTAYPIPQDSIYRYIQ